MPVNVVCLMNQLYWIKCYISDMFSSIISPHPQGNSFIERYFYSLQIQSMHIMSQINLYMCVCVCADIFHWAQTHPSKFTLLIISSPAFPVYHAQIDGSICTSIVSSRKVNDSSSNKCLNYLFWGLSLTRLRGTWSQQLCLLISAFSLSSTATAQGKHTNIYFFNITFDPIYFKTALFCWLDYYMELKSSPTNTTLFAESILCASTILSQPLLVWIWQFLIISSHLCHVNLPICKKCVCICLCVPSYVHVCPYTCVCPCMCGSMVYVCILSGWNGGSLWAGGTTCLPMWSSFSSLIPLHHHIST